ncbi:hypothetical protein C8Q72DRAFT_887002 [Fomitopsis betulina]|nr:hypothetical protein C8Q72DRAFT_887002 [Fomitopsis betulina]
MSDDSVEPSSQPSSPRSAYSRAEDIASRCDIPQPSEYDDDSDYCSVRVATHADSDLDEPIARTGATSEEFHPASSSGNCASPTTLLTSSSSDVDSANPVVDNRSTQQDRFTTSPPTDQSKEVIDATGRTTPVIAKSSTLHYHSAVAQAGLEDIKVIRRDYVAEMELRTAQISVDAFMQAFLPQQDLPATLVVPELNPACFQSQEVPMYAELCKVANSVFAAATQDDTRKLVAKDTHSFPDPTDKNDYDDGTKPDVTVYPVTAEAERAYTIQRKGTEQVIKPEFEARVAWSWARLCIEAKVYDAASPFVVPKQVKSDTTDDQPDTTQRPKKSLPKRKATVNTQNATSGLQPEPVQSRPASPPVDQTLSAPLAEGLGSHVPQTVSSTDSPTGTATPATSAPSLVPSFLRVHTEGGMQTMTQISRYAAKIMRRQFLAYCFTIFVCRNYAWLMRWDRAGLVISEPFDFLQQPQLLHAFFYRFACMTDVERGCDPTVKPATQDEIERMRAFKTFDTDWHRAKFQASLEEGRIMKILVPAADIITAEELEAGKKKERTDTSVPKPPPREFLVGKPHFMGNSPTGSGTKGFIAYDVTEDRLVFLKDCWRPQAETYHPEGEVYLHLHSHNVNFIATPVAAGDVVDDEAGIHTTCADKLLNTPRWIHYRLILKEVAMPLEEYQDSYELVAVLYSAVSAHQQAWQAEVLHRDVSAFNIMIYRYRDPVDNVVKYKGLLVDWGLCKFAQELKQPAVQKNRSGTWQFISAVLLIWPGRFRHEVWHDLESFIHVFHWCCVRFYETTFYRINDDINELQKFVSLQYDAHSTVNGISVGGRHKLAMLRGGAVPFCLAAGSFDAALTRDDPLRAGYGLDELLTSLALLYKEHYQWLAKRIPGVARPSNSKEAPGPASQPAPSTFGGLDFGERTRTAPEFQSLKPAQPVLRDHTAFLALLYEAVRIHPSCWIYHPKLPDNFAKFKYSSAAQRANASSQSSGKRPANATENALKRPKMDSSVHASSSTSQLVPISEGILDTAV